jgi:hypothetical protein
MPFSSPGSLLLRISHAAFIARRENFRRVDSGGTPPLRMAWKHRRCSSLLQSEPKPMSVNEGIRVNGPNSHQRVCAEPGIGTVHNCTEALGDPEHPGNQQQREQPGLLPAVQRGRGSIHRIGFSGRMVCVCPVLSLSPEPAGNFMLGAGVPRPTRSTGDNSTNSYSKHDFKACSC